jgi:hypothetical protein
MATDLLQPLQYSVHDWANCGAVVWTEKQGHLCPELETPALGETVIYIDYERLPGDTLVQSDTELAVDAMGYPAGPRWIGRSSLDVDAVVSYVGTFPIGEVAKHLKALHDILPSEVLVVREHGK